MRHRRPDDGQHKRAGASPNPLLALSGASWGEKKKRAFVSYKLIAYSTQVSADMDTYMIRQPLGVVGASSCLGLLAIM